jgi:uncharacterized protein
MLAKDYPSAVQMFETACKCASNLSAKTSGRQVPSWREQYASYIFARICTTSISILRTLPQSSLHTSPFSLSSAVWDLPSVCTLTRSLLETWLVFRYLIVETENSDEEADFRFALWHLHSECERLEMLQLIGSSNPRLSELQNEINQLRARLQATVPFSRLSDKRKVKLLSGDVEIPPVRVDVAKRAGICPEYYRAMYKYFSNHAHMHPFSVGQIATFRAGEESSTELMTTTVNRAIGILCFSIRDFVRLFPDQQEQLPSEIWNMLDFAEYIMAYEKLVIVDRGACSARLRHSNVSAWDIWTKEISEFEWHYDQIETCYFLEGEVVVTPAGDEPFRIGKGDLVTFPNGMSCVWKVLKPVKKHYKFG